MKEQIEISNSIQFVSNGPFIPYELLQLLEEGKLVIFCGAGISFKLGFESFKKLAEDIREKLNIKEKGFLNSSQKSSWKSGDYSKFLNQVSHDYGEEKVKNIVNQIFSNIPEDADYSTHAAILKLSEHSNCFRLITTNFEDGFNRAAKKHKLGKLEIDIAPKLPIPKANWASVVHLHGLADSKNDPQDFIITSADFGRAYLIDGWATRFLLELFKEFNILFIGYSLNDPIVGYMVDALAAIRKDRKISSNKLYAFCGYEADETEIKKEWEAKGVIPILYNSSNNHDLLHQTIQNWAECYSLGIEGKKRIALECAISEPSEIKNTSIKTQFLWAISDPEAAKIFACHTISPSIKWLSEIEHASGIIKASAKENYAGLILANVCDKRPLNPTAIQLIEWFVKYLDSEELIRWIIKNNNLLHHEFVTKVSKIISDKFIANQKLNNFWKLLISRSFICPDNNHCVAEDIFHSLTLNNLDSYSERQIASYLQPFLQPIFTPSGQISITKSDTGIKIHPMMKENPIETVPNHLKSSFNNDFEIQSCPFSISYEIKFSPAGEYLLYILKECDELSLENTTKITWILSATLTQCLRLLLLTGEADHDNDSSYIFFPSIAPHPQHQFLPLWTQIIELLRDYWEKIKEQNPKEAYNIALNWRLLKFPLFRRLLFYTMSFPNLFKLEEIVEALTEERGKWLSNLDVQNERLLLLDSIASQLKENSPLCEFLISSITSISDNKAIFLNLKKLKDQGVVLPDNAEDKLNAIKGKHQHINEDNLPFIRHFIIPSDYLFENQDRLSNEEIILYLEADQSNAEGLFSFSNRSPEKAFILLEGLAAHNRWESNWWSNILFGIENNLTAEQVIKLCQFLLDAPDGFIEGTLDGVARFLNIFSGEIFEDDDRLFFELFDKATEYLVKLEIHLASDNHQTRQAYNHPAGNLTTSLLTILSKRKNVDQGIPSDIKSRLISLVINTNKHQLISLLAICPNLAWIFGIDPIWTKEHILKYFHWGENNAWTQHVWSAYLTRLGMTPSLFNEIKLDLLEAIKLLDTDNKDIYQNLCYLFISLCMQNGYFKKTSQVRLLLANLKPEQLEFIAFAIFQITHTSGGKSHELWRKKISPWLKSMWPQNKKFVTSEISNNLIRAAIYGGVFFGEAEKVLSSLGLLTILKEQDLSLRLMELLASDTARYFPNETLDLLDKIISHNFKAMDYMFKKSDEKKLKTILKIIVENNQEMLNDSRYLKLLKHLEP